jgi:transposase
MFYGSPPPQVYLALGSTDMRKSINGLSILVQEHLEMNPLSGHLFVFCNRSRNMIQVLYWDRNGFCLWKKRLERQHFTWPESVHEVMEIDQRQLGWLLEGLDMCRMKAHEALRYSTLG